MCRGRDDLNPGLGMRPSPIPNRITIFHERQPATAGPNLNTDLLSGLQRKIFRSDPGVVKGFTRGGECQRHGARNMFSIFGAKLRLPIKVPDLSGNFYRWIRNIEGIDTADSAGAVVQ